MLGFDFSEFHNTWGQVLSYKTNSNVHIEEGVFEEKTGTANFIVQSISDRAIRENYNITGDNGLSFYSSVPLSINDLILFNGKEYKVVEVISQYPNGNGLEYHYIGYISGSMHEV